MKYPTFPTHPTVVGENDECIIPDLIQTLVDSYKHDAKRVITDMEHRGKPHEFPTYGPKAFAAHNNFDPDLKDRCIQISTLPSPEPVEPLLAEDRRLDQLRIALYRFTFFNRARLFETCAYSSRSTFGEALKLEGREWELWWPVEVVFEWMDVPMEQRERARKFYRKSIVSTKAELSAEQRVVLEELARTDMDGPLIINSREFKTSPFAVGSTKLGTILSDFQLVLARSRPRVNGTKCTEWEIDRDQLAKRIDAWEIET